MKTPYILVMEYKDSRFGDESMRYSVRLKNPKTHKEFPCDPPSCGGWGTASKTEAKKLAKELGGITGLPVMWGRYNEGKIIGELL